MAWYDIMVRNGIVLVHTDAIYGTIIFSHMNSVFYKILVIVPLSRIVLKAKKITYRVMILYLTVP